MLRFNRMEPILFNCPEYSVMTLSLSRTHISYWLTRLLLRNFGFEANPTLADHSQTVREFMGALPWFQALNYHFGLSAKLLTSLTAKWWCHIKYHPSSSRFSLVTQWLGDSLCDTKLVLVWPRRSCFLSHVGWRMDRFPWSRLNET